jgi:hypothetical protein
MYHFMIPQEKRSTQKIKGAPKSTENFPQKEGKSEEKADAEARQKQNKTASAMRDDPVQ